MLNFIKDFYRSIEHAALLREIASRYAGQPELMRERMLEVIEKIALEGQESSTIRTTEKFEAVTA